MADISKLGSTNLIKSIGESSQLPDRDSLDFTKLNSNKKTLNEKQAEEQKKIKEVADLYEKYFVKEMIKGMRSTVQEGGFLKANHAEQIFREQLDDEYAGEWNKRGGFGLSEMIYQQLSQQLTGQYKKNIEQPKGPIGSGENLSIKKMDDTYLLKTPDKTVSDVHSPWAGKLQNKFVTDDNKTSVQIRHDNGLESVLLLDGPGGADLQKLQLGDTLAAGQKIGMVDSRNALVWKLKNSVSE